jgi:hypothetical protein
VAVLIAYKHGYRGMSLLSLTATCFILLNLLGAVGIWFGRKSKPAQPNRFVIPFWIAIAVLALIYLLDYLFPAK